MGMQLFGKNYTGTMVYAQPTEQINSPTNKIYIYIQIPLQTARFFSVQQTYNNNSIPFRFNFFLYYITTISTRTKRIFLVQLFVYYFYYI